VAPKPERARAILTWTRRDLAAPIPPTEPIYQPQHLILY
jgi:hypothetical protein